MTTSETDQDLTLEDLRELSARMTQGKAASAVVSSRGLYAEGHRFRVARHGARLEGIITFGESSWGGWSRTLDEGETVVCTGWVDGVPGFTADHVPENAEHVALCPVSGLFMPWPMPGYLEPISAPEEGA